MKADEYLAFAAIAAAPFLFVYALRTFLRPQEEVFPPLFDGVKTFDGPGPGLVFVEFSTYRGIVAWVTITPLQFYATPQDARVLLGRLYWFNIKHGLLAYGGVLVPIFTNTSYRKQIRSIEEQQNAAHFVERESAQPEESTDDV